MSMLMILFDTAQLQHTI